MRLKLTTQWRYPIAPLEYMSENVYKLGLKQLFDLEYIISTSFNNENITQFFCVSKTLDGNKKINAPGEARTHNPGMASIILIISTVR